MPAERAGNVYLYEHLSHKTKNSKENIMSRFEHNNNLILLSKHTHLYNTIYNFPKCYTPEIILTELMSVIINTKMYISVYYYYIIVANSNFKFMNNKSFD